MDETASRAFSCAFSIAGLSFDLRRMLVVRGRAVGSPDLRVCRAQLEVEVPDAGEVLRKWQGFHWVYVYGDYTRELEMLAELKGMSPIAVKRRARSPDSGGRCDILRIIAQRPRVALLDEG